MVKRVTSFEPGGRQGCLFDSILSNFYGLHHQTKKPRDTRAHLVDAPSSFESQFLGHLLPHVLVGHPGLAAKLVDDLEEAIQVHLSSVDHWSPVDGGSSVLHVLVQFCHLEMNGSNETSGFAIRV